MGNLAVISGFFHLVRKSLFYFNLILKTNQVFFRNWTKKIHKLTKCLNFFLAEKNNEKSAVLNRLTLSFRLQVH